MDDRKQRIDKLSERFKERSGRPKLSAKDRARRSFYLDNEIVERLDKDYKKFNHQAYPHTVSKSVFMETILEYGLNNLPSIKELIKEKSDTEPQKD
jgi:hypothetical protein